MPKTVTIRIDDDTYRSFVRRAKAENRSLANFIETAVTQHIRECDFADDAEIAGILGVSNNTVGKHLERIHQKLGVENRTAAAMRALASVSSR